MRLAVRPLSINEAYRGRRFKTKDYDAYCTELHYLLPDMEVPKGPLALKLTFGFSNKASDIDNPVKCFTDVLQKAYGFNDKMIYRLEVTKEIVPVGKEFVDFELSPCAT